MAAPNPTTFLSSSEVAAWEPYPMPDGHIAALDHAYERMRRTGQWAPWQMLGRRMAIGCVALEITQRCNLDCSYCYLSEASEALKDIPMHEVTRRIDLIHAHYGCGTDVQVTGGDPTLRKREELVAIVRYITQKGMRSSLFTNGIRATRGLLAELAAAGLEDVAFHVDMTQQRAGYRSEVELNALRLEYIERARGLPLAVIFNTTVCPDNLADVPALVRFFVGQADVVRLASFQVGADTGRGRQRLAVAAETVRNAIRRGAGVQLRFDAASAGHSDCNGYAIGLIVNGKMHDLFGESALVQSILDTSARLRVSRASKRALWKTVARYLLAHPGVFAAVLTRFARFVWHARRDVAAARGRIGKLSFFVHNFMDASSLEHGRCDACSFMVMTPEGPLSMCVHNAKRDAYLLQPARIQHAGKLLYFNPVTGRLEDRMPSKISVALTRKNARGRARETIA